MEANQQGGGVRISKAPLRRNDSFEEKNPSPLRTLKSIFFCHRNGTGKTAPSGDTEALNFSTTTAHEAVPIVAFVNVKSGSRDGTASIDLLKAQPYVRQIYEMVSSGPRLLYDSAEPNGEPSETEIKKGIRAIPNLPDLRIVIGGGDGTFSWLLSLLDQAGMRNRFPVATIPLGTGNDLAGVLGWGTGASPEELVSLVSQVKNAEVIPLDRWQVRVTSLSKHKDSVQDLVKIYNNNFSIGFDAEITMDIHKLREEKPHLLAKRFINKLWYTKFGAMKILRAFTIAPWLKVEMDGKKVVLPATLGALVCVNIPAYANGLNLWGKRPVNSRFEQASYSDGMIELVALTGVGHLVMAHGRVKSPIRLAQGREVKITFTGHETLPMQIDGEPWMQKPNVEIRITHHSAVEMLRFRQVTD